MLKGGRYTLVGTLGEGTQGETYEARDEGDRSDALPTRSDETPSRSLVAQWNDYVARTRPDSAEGASTPGRLVAIKRFRVGTAKSWKDVELAEREARTLASLNHPHLPRYIEHFEEDGALYLVMEKVEGESLASLRARRRGLDVHEVVRMIEDIAEALRYLHGRAPPIVHRDVKPGNILRRPDGTYALVDFGAVRDRLRPKGGSTVVGTFGFMAPEQFQGRASPSSDLYGLGATAITMLTGTEPEELPHAGLGIDVARALPKGTPPRLARALAAMLEPNPDRRVASASDVLAILSPSGGKTRTGTFTHPVEAFSPSAPRSRKEQRTRKRRAKQEAKEARRRRREAARVRRAPWLPRVFAKLGLLIAALAVWIAVGLVTPLVLHLLALVFGRALRRAAGACRRASQRSIAALGRASAWLSGERRDDVERRDDAADAPRVRIDDDPAHAFDERRPRARVDDAELRPRRVALHDRSDPEEDDEGSRHAPGAMEVPSWKRRPR